ncbi:MAG TPA: class I SAM-dependent methyltransferase [Acidimicrobiales bacterium]|jgi:SAM-dependent methyltransferase
MSDDAVLQAQRFMWSVGDYSALARRLLPLTVELLDALGDIAGTRLLDVGVGDGNTAIEAAHRGASVAGLDLTPEMLDLARGRASAEGVSLELHEGNAESLPFDDASFDVVVSVMGMIFAPDHVRAMAELARVCRPGGTVAITAWAEGGWYEPWRSRAAKLVPAPASTGPTADDWGIPAEAARRFAAVGLTVEIEEGTLPWLFPSPVAAVDFFLESAGPFIAFQQAATEAGHGDEVRGAVLAAIEESNTATDGTCAIPTPYILVLGKRS